MKRLLAVASQGGHSVQLMRLKPIFDRYETTYVSTQRRTGMNRFTKIIDANRNDKTRLIFLFVHILWIIIRERPDVVISSGSAPGFFAIMCGKLLGAKTIWVDSIDNAQELSLSGKRAGKFDDLWLTQWQELSNKNGPQYGGSVL